MTLIEDGVLGDYLYAIVQHDVFGTLCGYLGVPPHHIWYGHPAFSDDIFDNVRVHGGISYSSAAQYGNRYEIEYLRAKIKESVAYSLDDTMDDYIREGNASFVQMFERRLDNEQARAGEPHGYPTHADVDVWWIGFDCNHAWDLPDPEWEKANPEKAAQNALLFKYNYGTFRDRDYVYKELQSLAEQAQEAMGYGNASSNRELSEERDTQGVEGLRDGSAC